MTIRPSNKIANLKEKYMVIQATQIDALKAAGISVLNLGRGNPDQPTFPAIVEELPLAASKKENQGYPPYQGKPIFKQAIQTFYEKEYQVSLTQDEIAISNGSAVALSSLIQVLINPGETVLLPNPGFPGYQSAVALAGGKPYLLPLNADQQFLVDYSAIPEKISRQATVLFLNYPNNPTGATATKQFFEETVAYAKKYALTVIHDFAYASIYFEKEKPLSFLSIPGAKDVGVETYTLSKTFNMAGWRSAFTVGNAAVIRYLNHYFQLAIGGVFGAVQEVSAVALDTQTRERTQLKQLYTDRKNAVLTKLVQAGWTVAPPKGSFYIWARIPLPLSAEKFAEALLQNAHVAVIPGTVYGSNGEGWIRISLVLPQDCLEIGIDRIIQYVHRIQQEKR